MSNRLAVSDRIVEEGVVDQPIHRVTRERSEDARGLVINARQFGGFRGIFGQVARDPAAIAEDE